ncbi:hypothetical protein H257_01822 [Aphanomyces astaci]|uniref:Rho GDP-dissociation inhibitor n=1 Tax=Aphanomyces astaci TaxID=112090 RepID=W4H622_APHAT|nr:hypothetical protein H257_01822 [Aphanomyces astaci]ETV86724.1 hypothetical protein H257_01822 [Aphanomyces astaci]|eukprot:XP_009823523.1 hypothetical protein H257_01822 [Aphanomyces astaci]
MECRTIHMTKDCTTTGEVEPHTPNNMGYKMSDQAIASVGDLLEKDKHDSSLQRYKANLLGTAAQGDLGDIHECRRVVVKQFKVVFEDNRHDITYDLDSEEGIQHLRDTPFVMEEGAKYKFAVFFRVNREIVSGLRFRNKVRRHVFSVSEEVVLGSYAPQSTTHEFLFPRHEWAEAPSGLMYRGTYQAECKFIDSDNVEHLRFPYSFVIKKA